MERKGEGGASEPPPIARGWNVCRARMAQKPQLIVEAMSSAPKWCGASVASGCGKTTPQRGILAP